VDVLKEHGTGGNIVLMAEMYIYDSFNASITRLLAPYSKLQRLIIVYASSDKGLIPNTYIILNPIKLQIITAACIIRIVRSG
jgi:hypothetical protein